MHVIARWSQLSNDLVMGMPGAPLVTMALLVSVGEKGEDFKPPLSCQLVYEQVGFGSSGNKSKNVPFKDSNAPNIVRIR